MPGDMFGYPDILEREKYMSSYVQVGRGTVQLLHI